MPYRIPDLCRKQPKRDLPQNAPRSIPRTAAFSLIELLASMAILLTMVLILVSVFNSTSNLAILNQRRVDLNQVVRAVLDQMSRDIQRAASLNNVLSIYSTNAGFLVPGVPTNSLFMLCDIQPPEPNPYGSLVNVGYQIASTNVGGIQKFALERGDDAGVQTTGTGTCGVQPCSNIWWNLNCSCTTTPSTQPYWKLFSENIIGIEFFFYTNTTSVLSADSSDPTTFVTNWSGNALPSSVGVSIYTIDSRSYERALGLSPNLLSTDPGYPVAVSTITNNMRVYFTRIFVPRSSQTQ